MDTLGSITFGPIYPQPKPRKRIEDRIYVEWVATHPCFICGKASGPPHHDRRHTGMSLKSDDYKTVPVCADCHDDIHNGKMPNRIGSEEILETIIELLIEWIARCRGRGEI